MTDNSNATINNAGSVRITCPDCDHPTVQHSSEPGVGCLYEVGHPIHWPAQCPCDQAGISQADQ